MTEKCGLGLFRPTIGIWFLLMIRQYPLQICILTIAITKQLITSNRFVAKVLIRGLKRVVNLKMICWEQILALFQTWKTVMKITKVQSSTNNQVVSSVGVKIGILALLNRRISRDRQKMRTKTQMQIYCSNLIIYLRSGRRMKFSKK